MAPLGIALVFALVGCYTILQHPITENEGPEADSTGAHSQAFYRQNCVDCHADYANYPYGYFYGSNPKYYFDYPRWGYYYAYPWWWDHYWYDGSAPNSEDGSVPVESGTKAARRGGLIPPYVQGAPAINTPIDVSGYRSGGYVNPPAKDRDAGPGGTGSTPGVRTPIKVTRQSQPDSTAASQDQQPQEPGDPKAQRRGGTPPHH